MPNNLPTTERKEVAQLILEAASSGPASLIKFKKTGFFIRDTEVPLGSRFIAYCADWRRGYVKFAGDEKVDERIGRVADGFTVPERDELKDLDQAQWELDEDGEPRDPWVRQDYLPIENVETGERFHFVTSSTGGRIGVEILCAKFAHNIQKGLPTVRLAIGTFHTKKYRNVARPDFPIVSWENDDAPEPARPMKPVGPIKPTKGRADEMAWLNGGGPPEGDPDDPGYDLSTFTR